MDSPLTEENLKLRQENDTLRYLLAAGSDRCIYCGLAKADMAKCESGFPGCGRADDLMVFPDGLSGAPARN